jgi:hypothetical protein
VLVDGIHVLGGMQGFGSVAHSPAEPAFADRWKAVARALMLVVAGAVEVSGGEFRHSIERMERWSIPYLNHPQRNGTWLGATALAYRIRRYVRVSCTGSMLAYVRISGDRGAAGWILAGAGWLCRGSSAL